MTAISLPGFDRGQHSDKAYLVPGEPARRVGLALLCVVLILYFGLRYDNFLTVSNGFTIALNVSSLTIAAVGASLLVVSGHVDLSIGGQYACISVLCALVAREVSNPLLPVLTAVAAGAVLGGINGVLVRVMKISPIIVTLATMLIFSGFAYVFSSGHSVFGFSESFIRLGRGRIGDLGVPVIIAGVIFVLGGLFLLRSRTGLRIFAIGGDANAARLSGVPVAKTVVGLYIANGVLMGVVGALATAKLGSGTPQLGAEFEFDVLTAVILGGVAFQGGGGHPLGVITGVATIGVLNAGLIFAGLEDWWQRITKGAVLLLALGADQYAVWRRDRGAARIAPDDSAAAEATEPVRELGAVERGTANVAAGGPPLFACHGLQKRYGAVRALRDGTFSVRSGEVLCLVGDNGAGKSTLIKSISGAIVPDEGTITFDGSVVEFKSPEDALHAGIETVYQDLALCPNLGVAHNMVLGSEPMRRTAGVLPERDDRVATMTTRRRLGELGIELADLTVPVARLSGGQRQSVAIARAMRDDVKLVILDEPTAALGVSQTRNVLQLVRTVAERGAAVILISHDIETVLAVADRVAVVRLGSVVFEGATDSLTKTDLLHLMAGLEPTNGAR